ncbi:hypothetical protein SISSUDRAFT_566706 [Sistotremastrum suecicum HHB10207 ss-3]|uniref:Uncharacterized protein n=1 Tax=Sistotremastrum suecicum HHB10207 ss-3 TaxID=1314776 RepID=A0A165XJ83_9AGAM|nr:hypothetical protein SISSUDRAFT_566706 [Sistotremastrum suecicum HHB10207 ss-3]
MTESVSDDLRERLQGYLQTLNEVSETIERLRNISWTRRCLYSTSAQEEVKDCERKLHEAYQIYIFRSSVASDRMLSRVV